MRDRKKLPPLKVMHCSSSMTYTYAFNFDGIVAGTRHIALCSTESSDGEIPIEHWSRLRQSAKSPEGNRECRQIKPTGTIVMFYNGPRSSKNTGIFSRDCIPMSARKFWIPTGVTAVYADDRGMTVVSNHLYERWDGTREVRGGIAAAITTRFESVTTPSDSAYHWRFATGLAGTTHSDIKVEVPDFDFSTPKQYTSWREVPGLFDKAMTVLSSAVQVKHDGHFAVLRHYTSKCQYYDTESGGNPIAALDKEFAICSRIAGPNLQNYRSLFASSFGSTRQFSGNLIQYCIEAKELFKAEGIEKLGTANAVIKAFESKSFKDMASTWLSSRYAERLTVQDTKELISATVKSLKTVRSGVHVSIRNTARSSELSSYVPDSALEQFPDHEGYVACTTYVSPKDRNILEKTMRRLLDWDAYLTLENAWDMIPYSFVVDWFVTVGPALEAIDESVRELYYDVREVLYTQKLLLSSPSLPFVTWQVYDRQISKEVPDFNLDVDLRLPNPVQTIDGLSLLVQRTV